MAKAKKTSTAEVKNMNSLLEMDQATLRTELSVARKSLFVLQMKHQLGELKQPHLLKGHRRYIAQISTALTRAI